jgi:hypothetical protein
MFKSDFDNLSKKQFFILKFIFMFNLCNNVQMRLRIYLKSERQPAQIFFGCIVKKKKRKSTKIDILSKSLVHL